MASCVTGPPRELPNPISCLSPCVWLAGLLVLSLAVRARARSSRQSAVAESNAASISLSIASRQCFATWCPRPWKKLCRKRPNSDVTSGTGPTERVIMQARVVVPGWVASVRRSGRRRRDATPPRVRTPVVCCSAKNTAARRKKSGVRAAQTHMDRSGLTTGASETGCDGGGEHRLRLPTHLFLQLHVYAFAAQLRSMENEQESPARRIGRSMTAAGSKGMERRARRDHSPSLSLSPVCLVATNASS
jgi:hypothetical protein